MSRMRGRQPRPWHLSSSRARSPHLGDVAGRADHATDAAVRGAQHDAVLARPAHGAVQHAIAELAVEARDIALEQGDQRAAVERAILRMDAIGPVLEGRVARQIEHRQQGRRQIDGAGLEVPVVHILVDRLQREGIPLFDLGGALMA